MANFPRATAPLLALGASMRSDGKERPLPCAHHARSGHNCGAGRSK